MAVNPNIALAARGVEIADPMAMYGKIAAIQQAQNQNALAQYQLGAAQRAEAKDIARTNALAQAGSDDTSIANALLKSGDLKGYSEFIKTRRETQKSELDLFDTSMKQIRDMWGRVRTPEEALAVHEATHRDPLINKRLTALGVTEPMGRQQILQAAQNPQTFAEFVQRAQLGAEKFAELNKPQLSTTDVGGQVVSRTFQPLTGELKTIGTQTKTMAPGEAERIRNEGLRIGLEGRRVAVLEENARREADPAFQQRMAGAKAVGEAMAKGDVAAMQALPKVIGDAELAVGLLDQMVGKRDSKTGKLLTKDPVTGEPLKNNKPHPGFAPAVGMGGLGTLGIPGLAQITPGTDASNFKTLYDQVMGAAFSEAFETLKGGGAITEKEGTKATAARNRMSLAQSEDEFIRAALEYRDIVAKGVERAQAKAARASTRLAPAAPAAGGVKFLGFE